MKRKVPSVAYDMDDVVIPFTSEFVNYNNIIYGSSVSLDDIVEFSAHGFERVFSITSDERLRRIHEFTNTRSLDIQPIDGARSVIAKLALVFPQSIVSARQHAVRGISHLYLKKYFAFTKLGVTNSLVKANRFLRPKCA